MKIQPILIAALLTMPGCKQQQSLPEGAVANFRAQCVASANKPSPSPVALSLQLPWFPNGEHSYTYLGKKLGIFAAHGFDVTIVNGKGSDIAARALAAGNVDAAIIGGDALVLVNKEGGTIHSIGAIYQDTPVTIYSLAERGITKPQDLYGKSLGLLPGSNTVTQYEGFANAIRLDRKKIREVSVQPPLAPGQILAGRGKASNPDDPAQLDALVHYTEFAPLQTTTDHPDVRINEIRLRDLGVKIYGMTLAVRGKELSEGQLVHLKQAVYDSFMCAKADPTGAINALAEQNKGGEFGPAGKERKYATAQLGAMIGMACNDRGAKCEDFLSQTDRHWNATINTLITFGLLREPMPLKSVRQDVKIIQATP
jgi:NMT1/THI5 like